MARAISRFSRMSRPDQMGGIPPIIPTPKLMVHPIMGMNTAKRLNLLEPGEMRLVQNLTVRDGAYVTRDSLEVVGSGSGAELIYAGEFRLANNDSFMLRWRMNGVDWLSAGAWTQIASDTPVASHNGTVLALTSWNNSLVFGTQFGQLWWLQFYPTRSIEQLTESPTQVVHLTTFAGRIIASVRGTRIQWTVRNDNTDWTGLGSGYEDLLGSPGSIVDSQCAVIPVTDEQALVIRSNSVWLMSVTGNFDAPFRFSQAFTGIGSILPGTCVTVPGGAAFVSQDDVVLVSTSGFERIGTPIRRTINALPNNYRRLAMMIYDPRENELRLSLPDGDGQAAQKVWRYSLDNKAWTQDTFQFGIRSISFTRFAQSLISIDDLSTIASEIDSLSGTIDELGISDPTVGCVYATTGGSGLVNRDSDARNDSLNRDKDGAGLDIPCEFKIITGNVYAGPTLKKTHIVEVQVEYESNGDQQILLEFSDDGGNNWNLYDQALVSNTNGRIDVISFRRALYRDNLQFALSCANVRTFKLTSLYVFTSEGARIQDAR